MRLGKKQKILHVFFLFFIPEVTKLAWTLIYEGISGYFFFTVVLHLFMTSCSVLIMNILSNRHKYDLRTFVKMLKKIKNQAGQVWTSGLPRRRHTLTVSQSDSFWPSYGLWSVSECSKTEPEALVWSKVQQGVITPLPIYALSDIGLKAAGNGTHCQNDGKLKFDKKLANKYLGLYV